MKRQKILPANALILDRSKRRELEFPPSYSYSSIYSCPFWLLGSQRTIEISVVIVLQSAMREGNHYVGKFIFRLKREKKTWRFSCSSLYLNWIEKKRDLSVINRWDEAGQTSCVYNYDENETKNHSYDIIKCRESSLCLQSFFTLYVRMKNCSQLYY